MKLRPSLSILAIIVGLVGISITPLYAQNNSASPQPEPVVRALPNPSAAVDSRVTRDRREPVKDNPLARLQAITAARGTASLAYSSNIVRATQQQNSLAARFSSTTNVPTWRSVGPTSDTLLQNGSFEVHAVDSGRLRNILPDPKNPSVVYVLASGGGLWKTTNFTSSHPAWRPKTDFIGSTSGGSAALGKTSQTIYLGTGDPFDFAPGGFMVKSTDGGNHWSAPVFLTDGGANSATTVLDVKDQPGQTTATDTVLAGTDVGLFRSTDGGQTYSLAAFAGQQVWSLVRTSAGWLASVQTSVQVFSSKIPSAGTTTFFLSTDAGATWSQSGSGFANGSAGRTTLAVAAPGDASVYAFAATPLDQNFNFDQLDLFRSTDGGQTFVDLNITHKSPVNPSVNQLDMDLMHGQAWYNQMVLVDPTDKARNTVYLGGNLSSAKTTNGGSTWKLTSDWLAMSNLPYVHADFHTAAFSSIAGKKTVFFGCDGGLFISTNAGNTWNSSKNTGLVTHLIYGLTSRQIDNDDVLIALQDTGTRYKVPNSTVYNQVYGGDGVGVGASQANLNVSLAGAEFQDVERCVTDPCKDINRFEFAGQGTVFEGNFFNPYYTPLATDDPTGRVFFDESFKHVYETTDSAVFWNTIGTVGGNIPDPSVTFRDVPHGIGSSPDLLHVGVCATGGRVVITPDDGTTWFVVHLNSEVPGFFSFTSNVTWASNTDVYVTSVQPAPGVVRVVKSSQGGLPGTWHAAQNGLPDTPINRLLRDPRDASGQTLFATTDIGVYRTIDGGANWSMFGQGLPQVQVSDLYLAPDSSFLRISTYGRGVWETRP